MKNTLFLALIVFVVGSCTRYEPSLKYKYEVNPHYSWGYAEYYGAYYSDYKNTNNVLSLSLFSDSLKVNDGNLSGLGQYLYIEDIFIPADSIILPEGKYEASESGKPFTFYPGRKFPVDDYKIDVGAFLYYIEKNKSFTAMKQVSRGSFTVKITDSKHTITCDFVLSDSSNVTGSFTSELPHFDMSTQPASAPRHKLKIVQ